jgi:hypothetical protein
MWVNECLRDGHFLLKFLNLSTIHCRNTSPTNTLISPIRTSPVEKQGADGVGVSVCHCEVEWGRAGRTDDGGGGVAVSVRGATGESV